MKKKPRSIEGLTTLDDFLESEGTREGFQAVAIKEVLAWQITEAMKAQGLSRKRLDEFYIRNASLWLDLRILFMTPAVFFRGERRTQHLEDAVASVSIRINDPVRVGLHRPPTLARAGLCTMDNIARPAFRSSEFPKVF